MKPNNSAGKSLLLISAAVLILAILAGCASSTVKESAARPPETSIEKPTEAVDGTYKKSEAPEEAPRPTVESAENERQKPAMPEDIETPDSSIGGAAIGENREIPGDAKAQAKLKMLLTDMENLVLLAGAESGPAGIYYKALDYIRGARISIKIENDKESYNDWATFAIIKNLRTAKNEALLVFSEKRLLAYPESKAIFMGSIINEMKRGLDFLANPLFYQKARTEKLESYLFDMDAMYLEALFYKECLVPAAVPMGEYEFNLVQSLANDNLALASILYKQIDMDLAYALYDKLLECETGAIPAAALFENLEKTGRELLDRTEPSDDWQRYVYYISLAAFDYFLPDIIQRAISAGNNGTKTAAYEKTVSAINEIDDNIRVILDRNKAFLDESYSKLSEQYFRK